jgi:2'-5' RNA ligase
MEKHISYWLMPSEPFFTQLQDLINSLAEKCNSPVFAPHVTVYSGPGHEKNCNRILDKAVSGIGPISLDIRGVRHSPVYTKTLFVEFQPDPTLSDLSNRLRHYSEEPSGYILKPHLSLLYKHSSDQERQALASEINMLWNKITCNWMKAVSTSSDIQSKEDIAQWRDLYSVEVR